MRSMVLLDYFRRFHKKLAFFEVFCFLVIANFPVTGCTCRKSPAETTFQTDKVPIRVKTYTVQVEKDLNPVMLWGFTEPIRRAAPSARIMAKAIEVSFQEGDTIASDQVLIHLDTRDLQARRRQVQAAIDTATTTLDVARLNLDRMRNLQSSGAVSRRQVESVEIAHAQAKATAEAARSSLEELGINLSYAAVCAPFKGVIVRKMVEEGNMVAPGQPLFVIEDDSRLRIVAPVGTYLAATLKPGRKVPVRLGNDVVQGVIEGIVSSGSTEVPGLRVQLIVDNSGGLYRTGTLAVIEAPLDKNEVSRVSVPREALIERGGLTGTFVVTKDFTARLHWLILDGKPGDMVRVLSGLYAGDRVILAPEKTGVTDGQAVKEISG